MGAAWTRPALPRPGEGTVPEQWTQSEADPRTPVPRRHPRRSASAPAPRRPTRVVSAEQSDLLGISEKLTTAT